MYQRPRYNSVDRSGFDDCKGCQESGCYHYSYRAEPRHHRRLSWSGLPRHVDLFGHAFRYISYYQGHRQIYRKGQQRSCVRLDYRRAAYRRRSVPERTMLPVILQVIRLIKPHSNRILRRGWMDKALFLSVKAFNQVEHRRPRRNISRIRRCRILLRSGRQHLEERKQERALCHPECGESLLM